MKKNSDKDAWGPQLWHSLHMIALNYPDKPSASDKLNYKLFFESLKDVIPCIACADNYAEHLHEMPIERFLDNAHSLFGWTVELHNIVNAHTGKRKWTVEEAVKYYSEYEPNPACRGEASALSGSGSGSGASASQHHAGRAMTRYETAKDMFVSMIILLACLIIALIMVYTIYRVWLLAAATFGKKGR